VKDYKSLRYSSIHPLHEDLSPEATSGAVLPKLKNVSLLSFGQLCDNGFKVELEEYDCTVSKNNKTVFKGIRNFNDGLWDIPIKPKKISTLTCTLSPHDYEKYIPTSKASNVSKHAFSHPSLNVIVHKKRLKKDLIEYLHACCYSPVKSTWMKAIKKVHFLGFPGLNVYSVNEHLTLTENTALGHLHQEYQHL